MGLKYEEPPDGPAVKVVASDTVAGLDYEEFKPVYGGATEAIRVTEATPLPARDYHGGKVPVDTGYVAVVAGAPVLVTTAAHHWIDAIALMNLTNEIQTFTLTDGDDHNYAGVDLAPKECRIVPCYGIKFSNGIKMGAVNASAVAIQLNGTR